MNPDHPHPLPRTVLVAITKHGAAQAATLARALPGASVCVAARFADACAGLPNPVLAYDGPLKEQIGELFAQRDRALALGATLLRDRSDDPEEPLYVFADPHGHPFCIFVAPDA